MEFKNLTEIIRILENSFNVQFNGKTGQLRKSVLKSLAYVIGGALYTMSLMAKKIWKNRFVSTCDAECLVGFGNEYGVQHKTPTKSKGYLILSKDFEQQEQLEAVSDCFIFVNRETKKEYKSKSKFIDVISENTLVEVESVEYGKETESAGGEFFDCEELESFTITSQSKGIKGGFLIDVNGEEWGESLEDYRKRLLFHIQNPSFGGSKADYIKYAMQFPFVEKVEVIEDTAIPNEINIIVFSSEEITPESQCFVDLRNYLTSDERRPITSRVYVELADKLKVTASISYYPYNASTKQKIIDCVKSYMFDNCFKTITTKELENYLLINADIDKVRVNEFISAERSQVMHTQSYTPIFDPSFGYTETFVFDSENSEYLNGVNL